MHWFTFRSAYDEKSRRSPIQNAFIYILFCVARKKSENRVPEHDFPTFFGLHRTKWRQKTASSLWWLGLPSNYPDIPWCWIHLGVWRCSCLLSVSGSFVECQLMFTGLDIWCWSHWVNKQGLREVQWPIQALLEEIDPEIRNYNFTSIWMSGQRPKS